jgi:hypothetical protein
MGNARGHNRLKGYAILLLTIFLTYLCSNSLFTHYHYSEGGVITHSHIYTGTPDKPDHSHTPTQFELLATLADFIALEASSIEIDLSATSVVCELISQENSDVCTSSVATPSLRAPPVTMI